MSWVHDRRRAVADVVHEHLLLHADLRRREADARSGVHDVHHLLGQAHELAVDIGDRRRL